MIPMASGTPAHRGQSPQSVAALRARGLARWMATGAKAKRLGIADRLCGQTLSRSAPIRPRMARSGQTGDSLVLQDFQARPCGGGVWKSCWVPSSLSSPCLVVTLSFRRPVLSSPCLVVTLSFRRSVFSSPCLFVTLVMATFALRNSCRCRLALLALPPPRREVPDRESGLPWISRTG